MEAAARSEADRGNGARGPRLAGAAVGVLAALAVAALGMVIGTWRVDLGGALRVAIDPTLGLWGILPAAVAGAIEGPRTAARRTGLVHAAVRVAALTVIIAIAEILLAQVVALILVGPAPLGTSSPAIGGFVALLAVVFAVVVLGPLATVVLTPVGVVWAMVVRFVVALRPAATSPR